MKDTTPRAYSDRYEYSEKMLTDEGIGALFSAGAIPVLSVFLGAKVGCELSVIIGRFRA